MRAIVPLTALVVAAGASAQQRVEIQPPAAHGAPPQIEADPTAVCRDRIQEVRRELGKPELPRDVRPQDSLFIAAVDKRIGGCSVLVMRNDTSDIRPLPAPQEPRMMPAR